MKTTNNNNSNVITISEETQAWITAIAKLDEVFNGVSASVADGMAQHYKGMREQLVGEMAQCISQNICVNAHRI